jgi:hypothetical protein
MSEEQTPETASGALISLLLGAIAIGLAIYLLV